MGISSSQLTNSYFSEGWPQPPTSFGDFAWNLPRKLLGKNPPLFGLRISAPSVAASIRFPSHGNGHCSHDVTFFLYYIHLHTAKSCRLGVEICQAARCQLSKNWPERGGRPIQSDPSENNCLYDIFQKHKKGPGTFCLDHLEFFTWEVSSKTRLCWRSIPIFCWALMGAVGVVQGHIRYSMAPPSRQNLGFDEITTNHRNNIGDLSSPKKPWATLSQTNSLLWNINIFDRQITYKLPFSIAFNSYVHLPESLDWFTGKFTGIAHETMVKTMVSGGSFFPIQMTRGGFGSLQGTHGGSPPAPNGFAETAALGSVELRRDDERPTFPRRGGGNGGGEGWIATEFRQKLRVPTCLSIALSISLSLYIYICVCVCICIYIYMNLSLSLSLCIRTHRDICIYIYIFLYIQTYAHAQTPTNTKIYIHISHIDVPSVA